MYYKCRYIYGLDADKMQNNADAILPMYSSPAVSILFYVFFARGALATALNGFAKCATFTEVKLDASQLPYFCACAYSTDDRSYAYTCTYEVACTVV